MDFLEKLDNLMKENNLNKHSLSAACDIPYTTIDNWYKRGYEGLKLTTLRKLSKFFDTSLDYWIKDNEVVNMEDRFSDESAILSAKVAKSPELKRLVAYYERLNEIGKKRVMETAEDMGKIYPKED